MLKTAILAFLFCWLALSPLAGKELELTPKNCWELGTGFSWMNYSEPGQNRETGFSFGFQGSYTAHQNNNLWRLSANYYGGMQSYFGRNFSGDSISSITDDHTWELRGLWGRDFKHSAKDLTAYFTGLGFRHWYNNPKVEGIFMRDIDFFYIPIGFETARMVNPNKIKGFRAEFDWLWKAKISSTPVWFPAGYNEPFNQTRSGYGFKFSYYLKQKIKEHLSFSLEPNIEYWRLQDSDTALLTRYGSPVCPFQVPDSNTIIYGIQLNWGW